VWPLTVRPTVRTVRPVASASCWRVHPSATSDLSACVARCSSVLLRGWTAKRASAAAVVIRGCLAALLMAVALTPHCREISPRVIPDWRRYSRCSRTGAVEVNGAQSPARIRW